ncbi:TonB-dependent receptor [Sunxiuqinia elliptica]
MRITLIMLCIFVGQTFAIDSYSQNSRLSLEMNNVSIKDILNEIENQTDYFFMYEASKVDVNKKAQISVNNRTIEETLEQLFAGSDVIYIINNRQIALSTGHEYIVAQQFKTISGSVIDDSGLPLPGVTVLVKGTTKGTVTDADGNYSLSNVSSETILVFSFVGMRSQEIKVGTQSVMNVRLEADISELDEVVAIGYGVKKKANLTGAIATTDSETLENRPVSNIGQALQGVIGNLQIINSSGQASATPNFNIRGTTSLNGGEPLILVDDIPTSPGDFSKMNPLDVENITVLKDAASAAIYGSRASFGVILVTTKSGKSGKLKVNVGMNYSINEITRLPELYTDPRTVMEYKHTMAYPWYNLYTEEQLNYADRLKEDPTMPSYLVNQDGTYTFYHQTNWFKEVYKDFGDAQTYNFDISGGADKTTYYLSGEYNQQNGMLKYGNDVQNRYNFRSKVSHKVFPWLQIKNNFSMSSFDYEQPSTLGWDIYHSVNRQPSLIPPFTPGGDLTQAGANTIGKLRDGGRHKNVAFMFNNAFSGQLDLIKDIWTVKSDFIFKRYSSNTHAYYLPIKFKDGPDRPYRYISTNQVSSAREANYYNKQLVFNVYSEFKKTFNDVHDFGLMVGFNQEEYTSNSQSASRKELISSSLPTLELATGDMNVGHSIGEYATRGAFYRLSYVFDDKYLLELNGRYDGSSRFPKDDRFVFTPSVSLGWVMSQENFWGSLGDVVNFFKLRGSYGTLGNQNTGYYSYIATMGSGRIGQILDGEKPVGVSAPGLVSGSLTWETVTTINGGVDMNLFDNHFTSSFDIYRRDTEDMLTAGEVLPSVLGTSVPRENAADLKTTGWELQMQWKDQFALGSDNLNYTIAFTLSDYKAVITKFENPTNYLSSKYVGEELGSIWGLETLGFFESEEDIASHADQSLVTSYPGTRPLGPGDLKFADRNGDGKIDWGKWTLDDHGDYFVIGNTTPRYQYGFNLGADWNGFDLRMFLQGVGKRDIYPNNHYFMGVFAQPWANLTKKNLDHWTEDTPNAYFPRLKSYIAEGGKELAIAQTKYLQSAAYMRVKNITIGYTLPSILTQKVNMSRVRVYFSGDNLFEFTKMDKNLDPEGFNGLLYPFQRYYSLGLNVSF